MLKESDAEALIDLTNINEIDPILWESIELKGDFIEVLATIFKSEEFQRRIFAPLQKGAAYAAPQLRAPASATTLSWLSMQFADITNINQNLSKTKSRAEIFAIIFSQFNKLKLLIGPTSNFRSDEFINELGQVAVAPVADLRAVFDLTLARSWDIGIDTGISPYLSPAQALAAALGTEEIEEKYLRPLIQGPNYVPCDLRRPPSIATRRWLINAFGQHDNGAEKIRKAQSRAELINYFIDILGPFITDVWSGGLWRSPLVREALSEVEQISRRIQADYDVITDAGVFDDKYYVSHNPEVAELGIDPLLHFLIEGEEKGRDPSRIFHVVDYKALNPEVDANGCNALAHYATSKLEQIHYNKTLNCPFGSQGLPPAIPLRFALDPNLVHYPTINVLIPAMQMAKMSGGPNTALNLVFRLAERGFAIRIISTDMAPDANLTLLLNHIRNICESTGTPRVFEVVNGSDRSVSVRIGSADIFFATAWWTAQMAYWANHFVGGKPIIYFIQDYEPIFYPASSQYALAKDTYSFDHMPIINTGLLAKFLIENRIGKFADKKHVQQSLIFEPSIDAQKFFFEPCAKRVRTFLFYARPTNGIRNMFEIGVAAIRNALSDGVIDPDDWRFIGMGENFEPIDLPKGAVLECAPWLDFDGYAAQMRGADVLLSLMLSPHPSYPPIEMAACGGIVVTNVYENKTEERLKKISENIIAVQPSVAAITKGISVALTRVNNESARRAASALDLPKSWKETFSKILPALEMRLAEYSIFPDVESRPPQGEPKMLSVPSASINDIYHSFLMNRAQQRSESERGADEPGLISLISTVWNTAPAYLKVLADSVKEQARHITFEWYVLDNGSSRVDTREFLKELVKEPYVRLERVDENLGIIGGMRRALENSSGQYVLPLDSDDYLYPDCLRTLIWHIQKHGYPALLYTDEDKTLDNQLLDAYLKPDWDPVLFSNSCYIAHLCAIRKDLALSLGAYSDPNTEGSHDWDTFTRFYNAGHTPIHVPEVLYSWRMHNQSTSSNISSKPFVYDSQLAVLRRYLAGRAYGDRFSIEKSPLFGNTPDFWLRRRRSVAARAVTTIVIRSASDGKCRVDLKLDVTMDHRQVEIQSSEGIRALAAYVEHAAHHGRLVHIMASEVQPDNDDWLWEAVGLFEMYPDTVVVGGKLYSYGTVLEAGRFLGFGDGFGCPDRGRPLTDVGYFAQMAKPHSVGAVSAMHAVVCPTFLLQALSAFASEDMTIFNLGCWLGALAMSQKRRVIYSPFVVAETTIDWDSTVSSAERQRLNARFFYLGTDQRLRSPHFGLTVQNAYVPAPSMDQNGSSPQEFRITYKEWLNRTLSARASWRSQAANADVSFSILTTLYIGTNAELFRATAMSVLCQSHQNFEWIVLTHGPVSNELELILSEIVNDQRLQRFHLEENLGIIGGMSYVLKRAKNDYILPLDGDDLLASDALSLLADAVMAEEARPKILYSDEDFLVAGEPRHPYFRPDWDPVLDLENSWIWHSIAFSREDALRVGVYTDQGSEYCHDWDTMWRFTRTGQHAHHVRHITYHWRQHESSTSNSGTENDNSSNSVQHLLRTKIEYCGLSGRYKVAPYPKWRGAKEWRIEHIDRDFLALPRAFDLSDRVDWAMTIEELERFDGQTLVLLKSRHSSEITNEGLPEALKFFDFLPTVVAVGGRLEFAGRIVSAGIFSDECGIVSGDYDGLDISDPGQFSLGNKPQSVTAPTPDLCIVRAGFLRRALEIAPRHMDGSELGLWLGVLARREGRVIAYSPLVSADAESLAGLWRYDELATPIAWRSLVGAFDDIPAPRRTGHAGFRYPFA